METRISLIEELSRQEQFLKKEKELNRNLEETVEKKAVAETISLPNDLPPHYLPPTLIDAKMLDDKSRKLLMTLENKCKEFFQVGDKVSIKAEIVSDILSAVLSNLGQAIVNKLPDNGFAFTIFTSKIIKYAGDLSSLIDPIPHVSAQIQNLSMMNILDIKQTFFELRESIINPEHNQAFKNRAILCVLLTFGYGKLLQSRELMPNMDDHQFRLLSDSLIPSLQRLAQLGLFVNDAINIFKSLHNCKNITDSNKEIINETIMILNDLKHRAELIAKATNTMQAAITLVAMETLEKRFSEAALQQLGFFEELVNNVVPLIMESEHPEKVIDKLDQDLASHLTLQSAELYHDISRLLNNPKLDRQDIITKLKKYLCDTHENKSLSDNEKFGLMKEFIISTYNGFAKSLNSQFYIINKPKSDLADILLKFIKEDINNYKLQIVTTPQYKL